jgi:hypothetical protein
VHFRGILLLLSLFPASLPSAIAAPSKSPPWSDFQIIIWQKKTARQYQAFKELGVTAAAVQPDRAGETPQSAKARVSPIIQAGLRPYLENIATDFYSAYHRWSPDKPVNAGFLALQKAVAENPNEKSVFMRRPSLSDSGELARVTRRIAELVRIYASYRPLFFDLGDETGIADLSAAWDFDFSPSSLRAMRGWLKVQYGTLAALNTEWGTQFARWQDVKPPTTTETLLRTDGNYAAWSDFKAWMDVAFARAIQEGTRAVHAAAPWARAAIEGAQMPGWGGYDYTHLAPAVDVMELYDAGESLALSQAFNSGLVTLMTADWGQPGAMHHAWREFLRGVRGMILWDANDRLVNPDGSLGPDGRTAAPFLAEMQKPPAAMIMASRRVRAPIAVLYSPRSYQLQWLLDHRAMGASWTRLGSDDQNADNAVRAAQRRVVTFLDQLGAAPRFVSESQIAAGLLKQRQIKILVLPQTLTISQQTADAIRVFVSGGGVVVTTGQIGVFNGHGRRLAQPYLFEVLNGMNARVLSIDTRDETALQQLEDALKLAEITPDIQVTQTAPSLGARLEQYVYRNGPLTIVALLADRAKEETGQSTTQGRLSLPRPAFVYDLVANRLLGHGMQFFISASANAPTVLAVSSTLLSIQTCQSILNWRTCPP